MLDGPKSNKEDFMGIGSVLFGDLMGMHAMVRQGMRDRETPSIEHWVVKEGESWTAIARAITDNNLNDVVIQSGPGKFHIFSSTSDSPIFYKRFGDSASVYGTTGKVVMTDRYEESKHLLYPTIRAGVLSFIGGLGGVTAGQQKKIPRLQGAGWWAVVGGFVVIAASVAVSLRRSDGQLERVADFQGSRKIITVYQAGTPGIE